MSTPQRQRIPLPPLVLVAVVVAPAVSLMRVFIPALRTEQWTWILVAFQVVVLVVAVAYFVKFLRKQRDDYWVERGKDPKHPEL